MRTRFATVGAAALATILAAPANAGVVCKDDYQYVGGHYVSTPYCRDNYLAKVARGYGAKASERDVRNNPNFKRELCRLVGHDSRVRDNCDQGGGDRGGDGGGGD